MTEITVTVAVPVLNEALHLHACLDAIGRQTHPHVVEVLVVDGGSTDATREIAAHHPNVRVLDNPQRVQSAARFGAVRALGHAAFPANPASGSLVCGRGLMYSDARPEEAVARNEARLQVFPRADRSPQASAADPG